MSKRVIDNIEITNPWVDEDGNEHEELEGRKSINNKYLLQIKTGREYDEAVDPIPCQYTYEETDKDIPEHTEPGDTPETTGGDEK